MYKRAAQSADDLWKQGFTVGETPRRTKSKGVTEDTLAELLPWETTGTQHHERRRQFQDQIQDKLKGYWRVEPRAVAGKV